MDFSVLFVFTYFVQFFFLFQMVYTFYRNLSKMRATPHRKAVVELLLAGVSKSSIAQKLKISQRTVQRLAKQFREKGHVNETPKSGRPRSVNVRRIRGIMKKRIKRNDEISLNQIAKSLNISRESTQRIVKKELGLRSYRLHQGQFLTDTSKAQRLQKCKKLLQFFSMRRVEDVLWSDEKVFPIEVAHNSQNHRQLLSPDQSHTLKRKVCTRSLFPKSLMVWAGISGDEKTPLIFIDKNIKINAKVYQDEVLEKVVIPFSRKNPNTIFQQDWAPAHGAKSTLDLMQQKLPHFFTKNDWPSSSPDLNPLDFSVWGYLEECLRFKKITNLDQLKKELIAAWDKLDVNYLRRTVNSMIPRLEACVKAKGSNFEHLL